MPETLAPSLRVAIAGASSLAGGEFLRLALGHPFLSVSQASSAAHVGQPVHLVHPNLRKATSLEFCSVDALVESDLVVTALPRGEFLGRYDALSALAPRMIDLSEALRLKDAARYARTYGEPHPRPELLERFVYGLPELHRDSLKGATHIGGAGAVATAAVLALYPLLSRGVPARGDIILEARVGSSVGELSEADSHLARAGGDFSYALTGHPQQAELAQALPGRFPLHLTVTAAGGLRDVLVSAHVFLPDGTSDRDVMGAYREAYADEPFIRLVTVRRGLHQLPDPAILRGANFCDLGFEMDNDTGRVVVMSALDGLVKGAAGHALQSLNLAMGWEETLGLEFAGLYP